MFASRQNYGTFASDEGLGDDPMEGTFTVPLWDVCKHHDGGPHQLKLVHQLEVELDGEELPFVNQRCTNKVHGNNPIFKDLNANNPCQATKCKEMTSIFKDKHLQPVERLMARWRPSDR